MRIIELRAKVTTACAGAEGYDAEATVEEEGKTMYVHVNRFDGNETFTVSEQSVYDFLTGNAEEEPEDVEYLEEYDKGAGAGASKYAGVFGCLSMMLDTMTR